MTPSRLQNEKIGGSDFQATGRELVSIIRTLADLQPHERVLDVGCGYGRVAVPLTRYLITGEYRGFDIDAGAIAWCQKHITSRHQNFCFSHADVANTYYNPRGKLAPETFTFPCADASVDAAVATSLFTHLLPAAAARYVSEIHRVLKPGGRAVLSFFLFEQDARDRLSHPRVEPLFREFPEPHYAVSDITRPELTVAFDLAAVKQAFMERGMPVVRVERGSWAINPNPLSYQDFILAVKPSAA